MRKAMTFTAALVAGFILSTGTANAVPTETYREFKAAASAEGTDWHADTYRYRGERGLVFVLTDGHKWTLKAGGDTTTLRRNAAPGGAHSWSGRVLSTPVTKRVVLKRDGERVYVGRFWGNRTEVTTLP